MADQHNPNIPAVGNSIAADIPDIKENLEWHKDILQMLVGWSNDTIATVGPPNHRSNFRWKDADEIYIGPGSYFHDGTTRQTVFWDAEITFQLGSGGSNAGSDLIDAGAAVWHYIYLDDSAIVTNASPELVAACFLNTDVTAPTWSDAKHGWYNGNDRCIFAVLCSAGNAVLEFLHDGNYFEMGSTTSGGGVADTQLTTAMADIATPFAVPSFVRLIEASFAGRYVDATSILYVRKNGSASSGHYILEVRAGTDVARARARVMVDSNGVIEWKENLTSTNTYGGRLVGWYLPDSM